MRVTVRAYPRAATEKILIDENGMYRVYVRALAKDGKANEAVLKLVAKHFGKCLSDVSIVIGKTAREKVIEIR